MKILEPYICRIAVIASYSFLLFIYNQCSYAVVTTREISVGCNETRNIISPLIYAGRSDTQLSLITKGMRIKGTNSLITDWNGYVAQQKRSNLPDEPVVLAECLPYAEGKIIIDEYITVSYGVMWPPGKTLVCKKGEGISVGVYAPNNVDPEAYKYIATLVMDKDESDFQTGIDLRLPFSDQAIWGVRLPFSKRAT